MNAYSVFSMDFVHLLFVLFSIQVGMLKKWNRRCSGSFSEVGRSNLKESKDEKEEVIESDH